MRRMWLVTRIVQQALRSQDCDCERHFLFFVPLTAFSLPHYSYGIFFQQPVVDACMVIDQNQFDESDKRNFVPKRTEVS